jgi:phospholipid/cholesterol/gamma-HCH transport system ATP-binding protein
MKRSQIREIKFRDVTFREAFGGGSEVVFSHLNFEFTHKAPVILQGTAESGKRTLLKLLVGLYPIESGEYLINGESVEKMSFREFDSYRLNMGFSFESGGTLNNRTIFENLALPLEYHDVVSKNQISSYVESFLRHFDILQYSHMRPAFVSLEVRKVINLIRAFLLYPEFLILDNPTEGTGVEYQEKLLELIKIHTSSRGLKYLVIVSDDPHFIKKMGGNIYLVHKSELIPDFRQEAS